MQKNTFRCTIKLFRYIVQRKVNVIYNQYRADLREMIRTLCKYKGVEIIEGNVMPDHPYLSLRIPPKI